MSHEPRFRSPVQRVPQVTRSSAAWNAAAAGRVARNRMAAPSGWWGMALLLGAEVTLLGTMIASYFYLSFENRQWPPPGVPHPKYTAACIGLGCLVLASFPMWRAVRASRAGRVKAVLGLIAFAWLIQMGYLALEVRLFMSDFNQFHPQGSAYGSIYFTLLAADHAHILLGILLDMAVMLFIMVRGLTNYWLIGVRALALYWYVINALTVAVIMTTISPSF